MPLQDEVVIKQFGLHGRPGVFVAGLAAVFGVFALPAVSRATGVRPSSVIELWAALAASLLVIHWCCYRRARHSRIAFHVLVFGTVVAGATVCLGLPVLGRTPQTPLWLAFCVMACVNAASETEASVLLGLFHAVAPLATIPFFVLAGARPPWLLVGPLTSAIASGYGYHFLARRGQLWRQQRHEREMNEARRRLELSERERASLARDLHDSVGTALSLVALMGTLVENQAEDPDQARRLATSIRDAARTGLSELRAVLRALPRGEGTLDQLATGLHATSAPSVAAAGAILEVRVRGSGETPLDGTTQAALARMGQEAIHNALRHGRSRNIEVSLSADPERVEVVVADDGCGFDPTHGTRGTGLRGMQDRASALGGHVRVDSRPGAGARVRFELPRPAIAQPGQGGA